MEQCALREKLYPEMKSYESQWPAIALLHSTLACKGHACVCILIFTCDMELISTYCVLLAETTTYTLFESENERQKIEPVPIPLPRVSRNFPDVKTRNDFFFIIGLRR